MTSPTDAAEPAAAGGLDAAIGRCRDLGMRLSRQRRMVLDLLWQERDHLSARDIFERLNARGRNIGHTSVYQNLEALRAMAEASSIPVIASGGIGTLEDILSLLSIAPLGVEGVIVGRALYDGTVDLAEALQAIGPERLQDALTSPTGSITG